MAFRIGDEEKKRRGTFRADESEAELNAKAGAKIITGVFLSKVPTSDLPLNEIGQKKYEEFAQQLLENGTLTKFVAEEVAHYAIMHQTLMARLAAGKLPPQGLLNAMESKMRRLRVAENAPIIGNPNKQSRFNGAGFANVRSTPFRLRSPRSA